MENALKLRNLSKTRWIYRYESIEAIWRSFEAIKDALAVIESMKCDTTTTRKASSLLKKILDFNFVFAIMFMRLVMTKTQILTTEMQKPELNILDALTLIDATVTSLEKIRNSEDEMNNQIQSSVEFAKSLGLKPEEEFARKRPRRVSIRVDDRPETAAAIQFQEYHRKGMCEVLDSLIMEYRDDIKQCLEKLKPLAEVLQPPLAEPTDEQLESVSRLFPPSVAINPECLCAEFSVFVNIVNNEKESCRMVHDVAEVAFRNRSILPTTYKCFKLLLTAPVSVAKNERTFSKMKVIKNFLRSTMSGEHFEDLIVLAAEKDLTDSINLNRVLKAWVAKKNRKLSIKLS